MSYNNVLNFWFNEIKPSQWWIKDPDFDELIKNKFLALHLQASQGELYNWRSSAKGRLAEVIILDQFSRNIFRDTSKAFTYDATALVLAQEAISQKQHLELASIERTFLYMPYMHSESLTIHDEAVKLFRSNGIQENLDFEIQHRDIIAKFGRYPHRNAILNRESTPEELTFLQQPNSSF